MRRVSTALLIALMLASPTLVAPSGQAGGFATVHLDEPPGDVVAGEPWRIGFTVMAHDVTPVNVESVLVSATHRETGESASAPGTQEGPVGHYVAEITFPRAGSWKWSIIPAPFAPTSFESLTVVDMLVASDSKGHQHEVTGHPVRIRTGTCASLGTEAFVLSDVVPGGVTRGGDLLSTSGDVGTDAGVPVAISESTIEVSLDELIAGPHAVNVHKSSDDPAATVACGEIAGQMLNGSLVIGLQQVNASGDVGVATLTEGSDSRTMVRIFMVTVSDGSSVPIDTGNEVAIEITTGPNGWMFAPGQVEIPAGTTVRWVNKTESAHTVTSDNLTFEDSGPFRTDETYRQTFTAPGEYAYWCGPHPWMTGTIVVT